MKDTTRGENIFEEVSTVFNQFELRWEKLSGISTEGAPATVGSNLGVVSRIKLELSSKKIDTEDLSVFHCIIHLQNLCAKSIKFKHVMNIVGSCVNFIKSRALNYRQFQEFLEDVQSDYEDLTFYCEVDWLSKRKMLKRFYDLKDEVSVFMDMKGKPVEELKNTNWLCDLAFLVDVTTHRNELNSMLQTQEHLVHELYGHIKSFQNKLRLLEKQLRTENTYHFPTLANHKININFKQFANELKSMYEEFNIRFQDFCRQETSLKIFSSPFDVDVDQAPFSLQMELIELQEKSDLKAIFRDVPLTNFYSKYFPTDKFPNLASFAQKKMALFGSIYICEQLF